MTDLHGKTAIITGASRGIGLAAAQALATAGANVVLTSRKQDAADEAAAQIVGSVIGIAAHAVDEDQSRRYVDLTLDTFGSVDIKTFDVNLWAPLLWTGLATTAWMGEHGGSVIKIRVNAVAPGVVRTRLPEALWKDHESQVAAFTALNRIGEPDDVAAAVVFLASDAAAWITGETMVIDGGQRLGDARPFRYGAMLNA
jgi:NAD(P)-dependent dehydrogenase (short-subunit alcohol dehydrogenase family)